MQFINKYDRNLTALITLTLIAKFIHGKQFLQHFMPKEFLLLCIYFSTRFMLANNRRTHAFYRGGVWSLNLRANLIV